MKTQMGCRGGYICVQGRPFRKADLWSGAWRKWGNEPHGHCEQGVLGRGKSEHLKWGALQQYSWMGPRYCWWPQSGSGHSLGGKLPGDGHRSGHTVVTRQRDQRAPVGLWGNWFSSRTGFSIVTHPPSLTCSDLSAHGMLSWAPNDLLRWAALSAVWSGVTILFQLL